MSTNEAKPTPGPYLVLCEDETCYRVVSDNYGCIALLHDPLAVEHGREDELEANATLIRQAFDVYAETGLTPRELAEQVQELRKLKGLA